LPNPTPERAARFRISPAANDHALGDFVSKQVRITLSVA
jgi:hypothetical protein